MLMVLVMPTVEQRTMLLLTTPWEDWLLGARSRTRVMRRASLVVNRHVRRSEMVEGMQEMFEVVQSFTSLVHG